jgi:hypothetical protein
MSTKAVTPSHFCSNCGQAVAGTLAGTAAAADDPSIQFCCRCGRKKNSDGTCANNVCPFFGEVPQCA